jgi:hypothetical protein
LLSRLTECMHRVLLFLLVALAGLAGAAPAVAATWSPAAPVPAGANAGTPSGAIAADGTAVLAFVGANGIEAGVRAPGASDFGAPEPIAPPAPPGGAIRNLLVVQVPGAETVALWSVAAPGIPERIEWSARLPDGAFGAVHEVPRAGLPADASTDMMSASAGANGDLVLALATEGTEPDGRFGLRVYGTVRPAGGEFGNPVALSALGSLSPAVAVGPDGDAVVAWLEGGSTRPGAIRASRRAPGGAFAAPTTLDRTTGPGLAQPFVTAGTGGETVAMWYRRVRSTKRVYFAVRPAGADRFGRRGTLGTAPTRRYALAGGPSGDVAAVWDDAGPVLTVRRRAAGHGFAAPVRLSHQPAVRTIAGSVTGDGTLIAAWQNAFASNRTDLSVAGQAPSGRRTELVRLQPPAASFANFSLATGAAGNASAAWTLFGRAPRWSARG